MSVNICLWKTMLVVECVQQSLVSLTSLQWDATPPDFKFFTKLSSCTKSRQCKLLCLVMLKLYLLTFSFDHGVCSAECHCKTCPMSWAGTFSGLSTVQVFSAHG